MKTNISDHFTYRKLLSFTLPSVMMMIFTSIYGVVDGYFISNYAGKTPFAAINLIMPFLMILGGMGFMLGSGGSALTAMVLGEKKERLASRYFSMIVEFTAVLGLILTIFSQIFLKRIALALGASDEMLPYCLSYGRIWLMFITVFMLQNLFQSLLITAGKPQMGFFVTVAAGSANIVLDFIFVGVLRYGVAGAAAATVISQCVGGFIPLLYFIFSRKSILLFRPVKLEIKPVLRACGNGSSEMMSNISSSVVSIVYNRQLLKYAGENGVAAYGVMMYVNFIYIAIFVGYSVGAAPIVSYHYGAGDTAELKNMRRKSMLLMSAGGLVMTAVAQFLAQPLAELYVGYDAELMQMTARAFHIFALAFILCGINIYTSSFFTALNNGAVSALISFLRTLVFELLSVLLLPALFGIDGIWGAVGVAEVMAFIISMIFLAVNQKRYQY